MMETIRKTENIVLPEVHEKDNDIPAVPGWIKLRPFHRPLLFYTVLGSADFVWRQYVKNVLGSEQRIEYKKERYLIIGFFIQKRDQENSFFLSFDDS
eukprot:UN32415